MTGFIIKRKISEEEIEKWMERAELLYNYYTEERRKIGRKAI
jgi:hypothetical protein